MQEASRTVADAGVDPWMANATVLRQAYAANLNIDFDIAELDQLLAAISGATVKQNSELEVVQ